ncbi:MAG: DUF2251 domain-containing protein [Acidobacteriota bacterium]|nr:DUF2251 domain-containing protein [Acidobacteriota bacterium]
MQEHSFKLGDGSLFETPAPGGRYTAFFEDDRETGYFYALDLSHSDDQILDAVLIYNVAEVTDREMDSTARIVWSPDGTKCALLINYYVHAVFDFSAQRGYCRTNFPNFPDQSKGGWDQSDHTWSDDAMQWLASVDQS